MLIILPVRREGPHNNDALSFVRARKKRDMDRAERECRSAEVVVPIGLTKDPSLNRRVYESVFK